MSYILDALKKSERQRPPGPVPDLFAVHGPLPPAGKRRPWAAIAVAVLLVVAAAFGVWVGFRSARVAAPPPAAAPVAPAPVAAAPAPAAPAAPSSPVAPPAAAPALVKEIAAPPAVAPTAPVATKRRAAAPAAGEVAPRASAEPAITATPEPAAAAPPPDGRVVELAELPAAVRAQLPPLAVSGHIWSEEPALRMLTFQDRLVKEGGEAAPGVRLEEITQGGAVFSFQGYRFRVGGL